MNNAREATIQEEIDEVSMFRPHVVVLGAGASRAACPSGDIEGRRLPLMADFVDILGLEPLLTKWGFAPDRDFEEIFSGLYERERVKEVNELQEAVEAYFGKLEIPATPTIYDHLLLSLRAKDLIATFNWDPLLVQAYKRNVEVVNLPRIVFLHGSVATGYCQRDRVKGDAGGYCRRCGGLFERAPLLYPIQKKNYTDDEFIAAEWTALKRGFKDAFMITIFGYSGPKTDEEAIAAMSSAWGTPDERNLEQTSFITIQDDEEIRTNWDKFIHSHHYETHSDFYESWIAKHPRRTGEAHWNQYFECKFLPDNPIPREADFPELWDWFERFCEPEAEAEAQRR
jgi:hypothetical protein